MSARPGRIAEVIEIDLPQPRTVETREDPRFFELVTAVREALAHGDAAPVEALAEGGMSAGRRAGRGDALAHAPAGAPATGCRP